MKLAATAAQVRPAREVWRNWSNNHSFSPVLVHRPETLRELEFIVQLHDSMKTPLTVLGSGLSPNGLAFGATHAVSMEKMNKVLEIDVPARRAKFECGMQIQDAVDALREHGLMLPNLASINLQQLGGFYSVGAHGTGRLLPPVEEQILGLTIVTPLLGAVEMDETHPWFHYCKLGLGLLGVVANVTVQCEPIYKLKQNKRVFPLPPPTAALGAKGDDSFSKQLFCDLVMRNDHVKFMWMPHENKTVACYSNRTEEEEGSTNSNSSGGEDALKEMRALYLEIYGQETTETCFADLRAMLLRGKSLDCAVVKRINHAETMFHVNTQGVEVAQADKFMAFDCGGAQLVYEFCMKFDPQTCRDYDFVMELMRRIESKNLPAPGPIEHRFTRASRAKMSPAYSEREEDLFSWIGIVMYLPNGDDKEEIKREFAKYCDLTKELAKEMDIDIRVHWAKLEIPPTAGEIEAQREELARLYPVQEFNALRNVLDPNRVFETKWSQAHF